MFIGALVWVVSTQFLEKGVHLIVLSFTSIIHIPFLFVVYGALMAGIFEEGGRFIAFRKFLPNNSAWKDGIGYGVGHGGIESILVGAVSGTQFLYFAFLINAGKIVLLKNSLPHNTYIHIVNTFYGTPFIFLFGGLERVFALLLQIGLSLLVLLSVRKEKISLLILAIFMHALSDFSPGLYQAGVLPLWLTEIIVSFFGIGSLVWILKSKKLID